jgi:hypothetical protein
MNWKLSYYQNKDTISKRLATGYQRLKTVSAVKMLLNKYYQYVLLIYIINIYYQ